MQHTAHFATRLSAKLGSSLAALGVAAVLSATPALAIQ